MTPLKRRAVVAMSLAALFSAFLLPSVSVAGVASVGPELSGTTTTALGSPTVEEWSALLEEKGALGSYHREDGTLVVVIPGSGSSSFKPSDAASRGLTVTLEARDVEPAEISAIKALVRESEWQPGPGNAVPFAYFSPRLGKVRIFSDAPVSEFAFVLDKYAGAVEYVGRAITYVSRHADFLPHWGGAEMIDFDGNLCSSGFSVSSSTGSARMVTAAHCFRTLGETVDSPAGSTFGTVKRRDNYPTNDFELVGGTGVTMNGLIYCKQSATLNCDVKAAENANFTNVYCFSGVTSWEACQQDLIDSDESPFVPGEGTFSHLMLMDGPAGFGVCPGDSGSPWYRYISGNDIRIVGITSLGEDWDGDLAGCRQFAQISFIEKWTKIRDTYNVTIRTS